MSDPSVESAERSLRILHLVESWPPVPSGYALRSRELIRAQARRHDLEPRVLVSSRQAVYGSGELEDGHGFEVAGVEPSRLEKRLRRLRPFFVDGRHLERALDRQVAVFAPDLVHVHWASGLAQAAVRSSRRHGLALVAEERFDLAGAVIAQTRLPALLEAPLRRWFRRHLKRADLVIAASDPLADFIRRGRPDLCGRVESVPNAVDPERFAPGASSAELRRAWGAGEKTLVLGTTAKMLRYEGLERLVELVARLARDGLPVRGVAVGEGPEQSRLAALAARHNAPMVLPGPLPPSRIADAYRSFDLFVVPRRGGTITEMASPLKVIEAMATGLPVVARAVGDLPQLLADGRGVLVPLPERGEPDRAGSGEAADAADLEAWTRAVEPLLASAEARRRLGEAAREHVVAAGTWDRRAELGARLYRRALSGRAAGRDALGKVPR